MATTPPSSQDKQSPSLPYSTYRSTLSANRQPLTPPPEPQIVSSVGLCIAHYNEDLTWVHPYASDATIYSKGSPLLQPHPFSRIHSLPNIGRETHTYLHHITTNYHNLPPTTLFLQGDIHSVNDGTPAHTDLTLTELISLASNLKPGAVLPIGLTHSFSSWDGIHYKPDWVRRRGATLVRSRYTPGEFWREVLFPDGYYSSSSSTSSSSSSSLSPSFSSSSSSSFPCSQACTPPSISQAASSTTTSDSHLPKSVRFVQGACFAVTREAIWRRPPEWWGRMLTWFEKELAEMNPEEGHYMERFWWAVFDEGVVEW